MRITVDPPTKEDKILIIQTVIHAAHILAGNEQSTVVTRDTATRIVEGDGYHVSNAERLPDSS